MKNQLTRATVAMVHADMLKRQKGRSLDAMLAEGGGVFRPGRVDAFHGYYFLDWHDDEGRNCIRTAIAADEVSHPCLEGLLVN